MDIETLLRFQVLADVALFLVIVLLCIVVTRENRKRSHGLNQDSFEEFKKLIEGSQKSAEYLSQAISEGRNSLKELSYTLDEKERRLRRLVEDSEIIQEKAEGEKIRTGERADLSKTHDSAVRMAQQGFSDKDIADTLGVPEGEINLILDLDRKKIENG